MRANPNAYFEHVREVKREDLDDLGHVNNAVYLVYAEACARAHAETVGFTLDTFKEQGVLPVVRRHEVAYFRPATLGDTLVVSTEILKLGGPTATRLNKVALKSGGDVLVEVLTQWVWLGSTSQRPKRVPQTVLEAFGFV